MGKVHGSLARAGKVRPKVTKQDKLKKPRGLAHKRLQYNRRFVTAGNYKHISGSGYECSDVMVKKGTKLAEESCKYGAENTEDKILANVASMCGDARKHVEEQEDLNRLLLSQVVKSYRLCLDRKVRGKERTPVPPYKTNYNIFNTGKF